jgi:hypothetical protein
MRARGLNRGSGIAAAFGLLVVGAGCGVFEDLSDRLKTCEDTAVVLLNDPQTRETVNLIGPDEVFGGQNLLASGHSRRISLCLERGDRKEFRVGRNNVEEVAVVNCVASLSSYDSRTVTVAWTPLGIECRNW